jgi:hypothetical protein
MDMSPDIGSLEVTPEDVCKHMEAQLKVELERWASWGIDNPDSVLGQSEEEIMPPTFLNELGPQMDDTLPIFCKLFTPHQSVSDG